MCAYMSLYSIQKYMLYIYICVCIYVYVYKNKYLPTTKKEPAAASHFVCTKHLQDLQEQAPSASVDDDWWWAAGSHFPWRDAPGGDYREENDALKLQDGTGSWCILSFCYCCACHDFGVAFLFVHSLYKSRDFATQVVLFWAENGG